jgi:hypothetical protein
LQHPVFSTRAPDRRADSSDARSRAALDHFLYAPYESLGGAYERAGLAGDIWLSGCEGIALSARGRAAADAAFAGLTSGAARPLHQWFENLRRRLAALFGAPGCDAVLARSEVEAEDIFDALARAALGRPVVRIAAASPERPGNSNPDGLTFTLRDRYGLPRDAEAIDVEAARLAADAIAQGRDVTLHLAECSESGLAGPTRAATEAIAACFPGRVMVLIDARQMRRAPQCVAADLGAGFAVLLSGSTFAGGPRGAAALLLPPGFAERISAFALPDSVALHSAAMDWPPHLRDRLRGEFSVLADLGLGLRWECALAELDAFFALAPEPRAAIAAAFAREIRRHLAGAPALKLIDDGWRAEESRAIFPILTFDERGRPLKTEPLRRALAEPRARRGGWAARGRPVHVGSPLRIAAVKALRLSLSAPLVNDVAERIGEGRSFASAFQPVADDLLEAFSLWSEIAAVDLA